MAAISRPLINTFLFVMFLCTQMNLSSTSTDDNQPTCNSTCIFNELHGYADCRYKSLSRIPRNAGECSDVTFLDVRNNLIAEVAPVDMLQYPVVRVLRLGRNNISQMQANMCGNSTSLVQLDLNTNHIRSIPSEAFQNLHSLTELVLDSNDIDDIQPDAFDGLGSLTSLILNDNQIADIPPGLFRDLKSLVKLNIAGNKIVQLTGQVLTGLFNLKQLNLQGNRIASVGPETFQSLTLLEKLELNDNELVSLDATTFNRLTLLQELYLDNNNLTSIKNARLWLPKRAENLAKLSISGNPLHCNCDFEPIRIWYRNKNPNNEGAICASPPELEGTRLATIQNTLCDEPVKGQTSPRLLITTVQEGGKVGTIGGVKEKGDTWKIVIIACVAFLVVAVLVASMIFIGKRRKSSRGNTDLARQSAPQIPRDNVRLPRQRLTSTSPLMTNEDEFSEIYALPPDARGDPPPHEPNTTPTATGQRAGGRAPLAKQVSTGSITTAQDINVSEGNNGLSAVRPPVKPRQRQFSINEPDIPEVEIEFDSSGQACFRRPSSPESIYESVQPRNLPPSSQSVQHKMRSPTGTQTGYLPLPNSQNV